jgi:hypothetical protein
MIDEVATFILEAQMLEVSIDGDACRAVSGMVSEVEARGTAIGKVLLSPWIFFSGGCLLSYL